MTYGRTRNANFIAFRPKPFVGGTRSDERMRIRTKVPRFRVRPRPRPRRSRRCACTTQSDVGQFDLVDEKGQLVSLRGSWSRVRHASHRSDLQALTPPRYRG